MTKRHRELPDLSPAQREIMVIVWDRGEVSAREVLEALSKKRDVSRNTVRTLIERMEAKGWITHREDGRTHLYSAVETRQTMIGHKVKEVVGSLCDGSPEALVSALLDYRGLTEGELQRIRAMLNEAKASKRSSKRS